MKKASYKAHIKGGTIKPTNPKGRAAPYGCSSRISGGGVKMLAGRDDRKAKKTTTSG